MSRNLKAEQKQSVSRRQISEVLPFQRSQPLLAKPHPQTLITLLMQKARKQLIQKDLRW